MKTKSRKLIERKIDKITDVINTYCKHVTTKELSLRFFGDGGIAIESKDFIFLYDMEDNWYTCKSRFYNEVNDDVLREMNAIATDVIKILYADAAAFLDALSDVMNDDEDDSEDIIEDKEDRRKIN